MQSNVESVSSIKKKINVEIPADKVSAEVDKAFAEIRKQAAIKGFRKGKVPMGVIEKQYGDHMADEVARTLVNDGYIKALDEHKLNPVDFPVIQKDPLKRGEPFKFSATIEVYPEVELKDYLGVEVEKEMLEADDEAAVAARLEQLRGNLAQLVPAPEGRAAELGDFVTFDFQGSIDGVPFEGGEGQDAQLELGSGRFIPGFEEQMVGLAAGSETSIKVTFPEDYHSAELAGKTADFALTIKDIKVKELPELDDDFAKEFGEFETLDELKAKLAEVNRAQEEQRITAELHSRLMKKLVEGHDFEVPEVLVDRQLDTLVESAKQRLASQRMTFEMLGTTEAGYRTQFRESARNQVKGDLILHAVAAKESIEVGEQDIAQRVQSIAASAGQDLEKVAAFYASNRDARTNLIFSIREELALQFLLDRAKIVEIPRDQLKN